MFPKAPDQHKIGKPLVPNGLGVIYVLFTTIYLFLIYFSGILPSSNGVSAPLTLAVCILFGGFMGLLDDWMDLKWRYKAFMPLIAALPLIYLARVDMLRTAISLPLIGTIQFGSWYYFLIIPLIIMIVTNTINMLGGLNGLETVCPAIIIIGLMILSQSYLLLMLGPLLLWLTLSVLNIQGKIFVGNTGSFAIGMTIAAFAVRRLVVAKWWRSQINGLVISHDQLRGIKLIECLVNTLQTTHLKGITPAYFKHLLST